VAAALVVAAGDPLLLARVMGMGGAFDGLDLFNTVNTADFLGHESPGANLVSNARSLARLYAATVTEVDGIRLLRPETVRDARVEQSAGTPFFGPSTGVRWGTGFMTNWPGREMLGPGSFGHDGAGGQLGFAHPELQIGFGYQTIRPGGIPDDRAEALCRALRACL
jgi:CubicO group peptidase (beta-lactamase class C family)